MMTFDIKKLASTSIIALGLMAAPALAQDDFADWDADGDAAWSENEFGTGLGETGAFDTFDTDDDELISYDEYSVGFGDDYEGDEETFAGYDQDADSYYNEDEFGSAMFGEFDEDESGLLEEEEQMAFGEEAEEDDWF